MAELYGMANQLLSEIMVQLMTDNKFYKFVYYHNVDDKDILSLPDLNDPVTELYNKQVWLNRRPQKVLHNQDVNIFLSLDDYRSENAKHKKIKTATINIGILVHDECTHCANGSRDVALLERLIELIEEDSYFKSLGEGRVYRVTKLYGLNLEYNGYEVVYKIDGLKEK